MSVRRRWTHLSPSSASVPNTTNPSLHPYQSPNDPRSSSTASLLPPPSAVEAIQSGESSQRTLLCVFIHGFVGDETSFRSFPAHFHELLTILVQDTHVVHTKVYPKFKTRDKLAIAVDNFSRWLAQFISETTDVVLLGHSMGGLLAVDTVILQPFPPGRHRILGTISFDTPFIGIHPGVITSGLASLFNPAEKPLPDPDIPENLYGSQRTSFDSDDNTNNILTTTQSYGSSNSSGGGSSISTFFRPTVKPKKSAWQSGMNFFRKHQGGLRRAALAYVNGHLEFSGALMDFGVMKRRYQQIKALDRRDIEDRRRLLFGESGREHGVWVPRVRFVNYYTVSTGRVKKEGSKSQSQTRGVAEDGETTNEAATNEAVPPISPLPEPVVPIIVEGEVTTTPPPPPAYTSGNNNSPRPTDDKNPSKVTAEGLSPLSGSSAQASPSYAEQRKKEKTFCIIPREQDDCWVKVMMENVDEVGAHCGLFFVNGVPGAETPPDVGAGQLEVETPNKEEMAGHEVFEGGAYERLLGDVAQRVEGWVREWMDDLTVNPWILDEGR
ncbi:hypothetical protein TWF730_008377 [Orbilia blumenaviensis]|uniref:DUF676 domain-containing protein n=1 Tax=Orbilia blumenaviensis TaxID=1796055 RepID=A0AAV9V4V6_9PEZI